MSLFNRRALLEGAVMGCMAATAAANEIPPSEAVSTYSAFARTKVAEALQANTVYIETRFGQNRRHSSGFKVHIPPDERGPRFNENATYLLTCRHGVIHPADGATWIASASFAHVAGRTIDVHPMIDIHTDGPLSELPDVALMECYDSALQDTPGLSLSQEDAAVSNDVLSAGFRWDGASMIPVMHSSVVTAFDVSTDQSIESGTRPALSLSCASLPGNSGGPVLREDETIAGIIFGVDKQDGHARVVPVSDIRSFLRRHGILADAPKPTVIANATVAK